MTDSQLALRRPVSPARLRIKTPGGLWTLEAFIASRIYGSLGRPTNMSV